MCRHGGRCNCGRRGHWGDNLTRRSILVAGVDPVARGIYGALDAAWGNGMAGRTGTVRIGDTATPAFRWTGYQAYQRLWAIPLGASATIRPSPNIGLPSTHGDVRSEGVGRTVTQHLRGLSRVRR